MATCPFCAEEIQEKAIKCKHCGEMIGPAPADNKGPSKTKTKTLGQHIKNFCAVVVMLNIAVMVICVAGSALNKKTADQDQGRLPTLRVSAKSANVRSGPGTEHKIVATLNRDAKVEKIRAGNSWTMVRLSNNKTGWISNSLMAATTTTVSTAATKPRRAPKSKARAEHPIYGEEGVLRLGNGKSVPVASNQAAYDRLQQLANVHDTSGIQQLMLSGEIWLLESGTRVLVINTDWSKFEVRVLSGELNGRSVFVKRDFVWSS